MRDDNVADYPWLCYAVLVLIREYSRVQERNGGGIALEAIVEAILNGLSADARAFVGAPPAVLSSFERDRAEFAERFHGHKAELLAAFEAFRPAEHLYSPLSFFFNFSHNVRKGTLVDALLRGDPWRVTFNELLTALPRDEVASASKELLATTLMTYARLNPDRIRGQLMPVIVPILPPDGGRSARRCGDCENRWRIAHRYLSLTIGNGRDGNGAGSGFLKNRSRKLGVVARGFQPRRRTVTSIGRRPKARASMQFHMYTST